MVVADPLAYASLAPPRSGLSQAEYDIEFMNIAIALSKRGLGLCAPNPSVGVVIVRYDGDTPVIVGRGVTAPGGRPHGERIALDQAGDLAFGATIYVTLEPCARRSILRDGPSCTDAILCTGIRRVVIGASDPSPLAAGEGARRLKAHGIEVESGVCLQEANRVHLGHALRVTKQRPMVLLKLARTADGFAARKDGKPLRITSEAMNARSHLLRARSDAILIGIGTALADDPLLTCRLAGLTNRSPIRVILDTHLRLPLGGKLVATAKQVPSWVICSPNASVERERALVAEGVEVMRVETNKLSADQLDLHAILRLLADRGITRLMVEGGPILAEQFAKGNLLDQVVLLTGTERIGEGYPALGAALQHHLAHWSAGDSMETLMVGCDQMQVFWREGR